VKIRPIAIVASTVIFGAIGRAANRLLKTALIVDYGDPEYAREKGLSLRVLRLLERLTFRNAGVKAVTYVDPNIGDYLARYRLKRKLFLPPGGFWKEASPHFNVKTATVAGVKRVLYAGHVSPPPTYRLDLLADAAAIVLRSHPTTMFAVVGAGSYLTELRRKASLLNVEDRFEFLGAVSYEDSKRYIASCDVALQLLNDMCLGTKVMDYFSLGKAVVACGSFHGSYDELLRDRVNCLLVAPDASSIAEAISNLLEDEGLRRRLGENALEAARDLDWESQSEKVLELIRAPTN
jgi:glycosyltransferase involved in cell wall biosynthesis